MSLKDQFIHNAIMSHARQIEDGLEKLIEQGLTVDQIALQRETEWPEPHTMRLTTRIVRRGH